MMNRLRILLVDKVFPSTFIIKSFLWPSLVLVQMIAHGTTRANSAATGGRPLKDTKKDEKKKLDRVCHRALKGHSCGIIHNLI